MSRQACAPARVHGSSILHSTNSYRHRKTTGRYCTGPSCYTRRTTPLVEEAPQVFRTTRMAQLAQRLGFDLPDTLPGHVELLTNLLESMVGVHADTEAHAQHFGLALRQRAEYFHRGILEARSGSRIRRRDGVHVLDEIAEMRILVVADRRLHGNRLLRDLEHLADLVFGHVHALGELFRRRLAAHLLQHLPRDAIELVDGLDHMHRNANGARLVRDRPRNRLAYPPRGIRRKLVTATILELVHRLHQADVAFLDQVQELQAAVGVLLGDRDDQAQVRFDHLFLRTPRFGFADRHPAIHFFQRGNGKARTLFDLMQLFLRRQYFFSVTFENRG